MFNNSFMIPIARENTRLKLPIPTRAPITLTKEITDTPQLVADKAIKVLSI